MIGLSISLMSRGASVNAPSAKTGLFALGPSLQAAGEAEDIAGAGWANPSDQTLASVVALPRTRGVTPAVLTAGAASATYQRRQNVLGGETGQILISAIVRAGASDGVAIYAGGDSLTTVARTRITAGLVSGAVTFGAFDGLATFETRATMSVIALERLAPPYARVWAIMQTAAGQANGMICVGPGENGGAVTVDRCDAYRLTLPAFSFAAPRSDASGTEMTLSADWAGWALGGSVEYRVDGGAAVAVPAPGMVVVPTAAYGSLVELRAVYPLPVAGGGVTAIATNTGVTRIETPWATGLAAALYVPSNGWRDLQSIDADSANVTEVLATATTTDQYYGFRPAQGGDLGIRASGGTPGMTTFVPLNDFVDLNPGETRTVPVTYRRTGDVADRTRTFTVTGPEGLGPDLLRGVTPSGGVYTFSTPVPAGEIVDVCWLQTGGTLTPSVSGVSGGTATTAEWHEASFRAGPGGATTLTMAGGGTVSEIHARVVQTPGEAAEVMYLRAERPTASTATIDFGFVTKTAPPAHPTASVRGARWNANIVGTPAAPAIEVNTNPSGNDQSAWAFLRRTVSTTDRGTETPPASGRYPGLPYDERAAYTLRHVVMQGYGGALMSIGYRLVVVEDVRMESIPPAGATINDTVKLFNNQRGGVGSTSAADLAITSDALFLINGFRGRTEAGTAYYDALIALGAYADAGTQEYEGVGIDYSGRYDVSDRIIIQNYWMRWSPDAALDSKSPAQVMYASVGEQMRWTWRSWDAVVSVSNVRHDFAPIDADSAGIAKLSSRFGWIASACGKLRYWRHVKADGSPMRQSDLRASGGDPTIQTQFDGQRDNAPNSNPNGVYIAVQRPRPTAYSLNLTDVEVEGFSSGVWSPLDLKMGPNDAIGAFYRRDWPLSAEITRIRVRGRYGSKSSAWREATIT